MQAGIFTVGDPLATTLALWSVAHGAASLMIAKPYLPWGDRDEFADRVLCAAAAGHAVRDLLGGQPSPADVTSWLAATIAGDDTRSQ